MLGIVFALLSAGSFGLNNAMTRRGVLTGTVAQALAIGVPIGLPMFLVFAAVAGGMGSVLNFSRQAVLVMLATGILHFICGRYCNFRTVKAMGANLAGPVIQLSLVVSLLLAIGVLHESLTPLRVIGMILALLGPALMHGSDRAPARSDAGAAGGGRSVAAGPPPFRPRYAEGYLFGLMAAACYGVTPILIRTVVEHGSLGDSMAAGVISYCSATAVIALMMLWPGQLRHALAIDRVSAKWFIGSGVLVTISQMFLYLALALAPVSVVMPVLQLHLVFRYLLARLMNPHHEVFGGMMMLATALSMAGAVALSIDPEFLIRTVPLPTPVIEVLRWQLL